MGSLPGTAAGSPAHTQTMKSSSRWPTGILLALVLSGVLCQDDESLSHEAKLCEDKSAGELFRLKAGKDNCRDVIQCTAAGLQAIRCPPGLAFDLEKQTCDWMWAVKNCSVMERKIATMDLMKTRAILIPTPTEHLLVTKKFADFQTVSVPKMVQRFLAICVLKMIGAIEFHKWSQ